MAITPESPNSIPKPTTISGEADSGISTPNAVTPESDSGISTPVTVTPEADSGISTPNAVTPESDSGIVTPVSVSSQAVINPVAPSVLSPLAPAGINRALTPLFNFNATLGLPDSVTYSRSSSASYIETFKGPLGRFQKRLTNDYVGSVENIIFYSEDLLNPRWGLIGGTVIKDNNENMFKLIANDDATAAYILNPNLLAGVTYTSSVEVKAGTKGVSIRITAAGSSGSLYFNPENGTIISNGVPEVSIVYLSNGVYRISITNTQNTNGGLYVQVARGVGVSEVKAGDFFFVSKGQVTESAKPLPYVRTFDSAVTETFTANPRYEEKGLLVEGASTNLLINSDKITATGGWSEDDVALVGNNTIAPDGSLTATKMVENTLTDLHRTFQSTTTTSGITVTESLYVKAGSSTKIAMQSGINGGTSAGTTIFDAATGQFVIQQAGDVSQYVGNGWWRVSKNYTTTSTAVTPQILMVEQSTNNISYTGDGTSFIYIWGAQLEALPFATSYIRTEGSVVSRSLESMLFANPASLPKINENQTVHIEFNFNASGVLANRYLFRTSETNNAIEISAANKLNYFLGGSVITGSGSPNMIQDLSSVTVQYDKTANQIRKYENKVLIASAAYVAGSGSLTAAGFGMSFDSTRAIYGHISKFEIHDIALTANEVKAL